MVSPTFFYKYERVYDQRDSLRELYKVRVTSHISSSCDFDGFAYLHRSNSDSPYDQEWYTHFFPSLCAIFTCPKECSGLSRVVKIGGTYLGPISHLKEHGTGFFIFPDGSVELRDYDNGYIRTRKVLSTRSPIPPSSFTYWTVKDFIRGAEDGKWNYSSAAEVIDRTASDIRTLREFFSRLDNVNALTRRIAIETTDHQHLENHDLTRISSTSNNRSSSPSSYSNVQSPNPVLSPPFATTSLIPTSANPSDIISTKIANQTGFAHSHVISASTFAAEASRILKHATASDLPPRRDLVSWVNIDDTVQLCIDKLTEKNILSVPVYDASKKQYVAILHLLDCFDFLLTIARKKNESSSSHAPSLRETIANQRRFGSATVREVLEKSAHIHSTAFRPLPSGTPLYFVARILAEGLHAVPIVDSFSVPDDSVTSPTFAPPVSTPIETPNDDMTSSPVSSVSGSVDESYQSSRVTPTTTPGKIVRMVTQADIIRYLATRLSELGPLGSVTVGQLGLLSSRSSLSQGGPLADSSAASDSSTPVGDNNAHAVTHSPISIPLNPKASPHVERRGGSFVKAKFTDKAMDVFMRMREANSPAAVVVDQYGAFAASLSLSDLKAIAKRGDFSPLSQPIYNFFRALDKNAEIMSPSIYVKSSTTFNTLVLTLAATRIHQLYFVDDNLRPQGAVRIKDVLKLIIKPQI